jgi:hypothetical protein
MSTHMQHRLSLASPSMAAWTTVKNAQDSGFRIRGILFSRSTFWLVGNFWGTGSLTATSGEIGLRGPLNSARIGREETGAIELGNYLWRGRCLVVRRTKSRGPLYFAMTRSDYERALDGLVRLGWVLEGEGA